MLRFIFFLFLGCCFSIGSSQNNSSIDFVIRNLGINVDGHFNDFTIEAHFNAQHELERVSGIVQVSSIETGIDGRDKHLLKEDYFHAKKYKSMTLKSNGIERLEQNRYTVSADLTIKGITKSIKIILNTERLENSYKMTSHFKINRKDFNIGGGSLVLSKTVKINVTHYHSL